MSITTIKRLKPITVCIDGGKPYQGITDGTRWNGWQCPYFTLEIAKKVMKDQASQDDCKEQGMSYYEFNKALNGIIEYPWYDGACEELNVYGHIMHDGIAYYPVGYMNWIWEEA